MVDIIKYTATKNYLIGHAIDNIPEEKKLIKDIIGISGIYDYLKNEISNYGKFPIDSMEMFFICGIGAMLLIHQHAYKSENQYTAQHHSSISLNSSRFWFNPYGFINIIHVPEYDNPFLDARRQGFLPYSSYKIICTSPFGCYTFELQNII